MPTFVLSKVPNDLHQQWSFICKMKSMTKHAYLLRLLKKQVDLDIIALKERGIDVKKMLLAIEKEIEEIK